VYHKGVLGKLSKTKPFSTGRCRQSGEALDREGPVTEFAIPRDVFLRWQYELKLRTLRDFDAATRVYNEEVRFDPSVADELMKYRVEPD
jgi:hypothetical protein